MDDALEVRRDTILAYFELALDIESHPFRISLIGAAVLAAVLLVLFGLGIKVPILRAFALSLGVASLAGVALYATMRPRYNLYFRETVARCCQYAQSQGLNADQLLAYWEDFQQNKEFFAQFVSRLGSENDSQGARQIPKLILAYNAPGWRGLKNGGLPFPDNDDPSAA